MVAIEGIRISDISIGPSSRQAGMARISAAVTYPGRYGVSEVLWYEFPQEMRPEANLSADPWIVALLPVAVTLHQPLVTDWPADPVLLANLDQLMGIWHGWYPELARVPIRTAVGQAAQRQEPASTGLYFSGGVDSFYTLLYAKEEQKTVDDLIFIHGFDIEIDNENGFQRALAQIRKVAEAREKNVVPMATNLRRTRFREANWSEVAFGCLLAGAGLALAPHFRELLISSGLPPDQLRAHASHPLTDRLFSSSTTHFVHYGPEMDRIPKMERLRDHPIAINNLRVCYESDTGGNCCQCLKCVLVMAVMEVQGTLAQSDAFRARPWNPRLIERTYLSQGTISFRKLQAFAHEKGRPDVANAVKRAFDRTARIDRMLGLGWIRWIQSKYRRQPGIRRITARLRPSLYQAARIINRHLL